MYGVLWVWAAIGLSVVPLIVQVHIQDIFPGDSQERLLWGPVGWIHDHTGLYLKTQLWLAAALAWFLLGAIMFALEWLAWRLRMDPDDHAWTSLVWSLGTWRACLFWLLCVALIGSVGLLALQLRSMWFMLAVPVYWAASASIWFFAYTAENMCAVDLSSRWRWRLAWPGMAAFACAVLYELISSVTEEGLQLSRTRLGLPIWLVIAGWATYLVISLLLEIIWKAAWLNGSPLARLNALRRKVTVKSIVLPYALQTLRFYVIAALVAIPFLAGTLIAIYLVPQIQYTMSSRGAESSWAWQAFIRITRLPGWWWVPAILPAIWFTEVSTARLLVRIGVLTESVPRNEHDYAGDPSGLRSSNHNPAQSFGSSE